MYACVRGLGGGSNVCMCQGLQGGQRCIDVQTGSHIASVGLVPIIDT